MGRVAVTATFALAPRRNSCVCFHSCSTAFPSALWVTKVHKCTHFVVTGPVLRAMDAGMRKYALVDDNNKRGWRWQGRERSGWGGGGGV